MGQSGVTAMEDTVQDNRLQIPKSSTIIDMPFHYQSENHVRRVSVLGGGLAGSEAALQLANRGIAVELYEMRPSRRSPAHHSDDLAELVCSNSLKSVDPDTAAGALKKELTLLGSSLLKTAIECSVPAGGALAVNRTSFSSRVTQMIESHSMVTLIREEATVIPDGVCIVATGPLTSDSLAASLSEYVGDSRLAFFDAAAPIIDSATIDTSRAFFQARYDKGNPTDYLNCPLSRDEYDVFVNELVAAKRSIPKKFESSELFCACQPIEEIARKGHDALRFGPMKPVGLTDPRTGLRPWAVLQLRSENLERSAYNLVGFQTNLTFSEQKRVFSLIPALAHVEYFRLGVMHRNTFIDSPSLVDSTLALRAYPNIRLAGQLVGTEGYAEAIAGGMIAAINAACDLEGYPSFVMPRETALGSLIEYASSSATTNYQPMHVNWGLVPPLDPHVRSKRERYKAYGLRAVESAKQYTMSHPMLKVDSDE